jgi:hypothetical protein
MSWNGIAGLLGIRWSSRGMACCCPRTIHGQRPSRAAMNPPGKISYLGYLLAIKHEAARLTLD